MTYRVGNAIKVNYVALKRTTGLTDLYMRIYDKDGNELGSGLSPVLMTEVVGAGGLYQASFTPDAVGQWRIRILSATNGDDISKVFEIEPYNLSDIEDHLEDLEDKLDFIDGNVTSVKNTVESTATKVDAIKTKTDNLPADTAAELNYIKNKVDSIDAQINFGGYILN